jgi:hypothetical protein
MLTVAEVRTRLQQARTTLQDLRRYL